MVVQIARHDGWMMYYLDRHDDCTFILDRRALITNDDDDDDV